MNEFDPLKAIYDSGQDPTPEQLARMRDQYLARARDTRPQAIVREIRRPKAERQLPQVDATTAQRSHVGKRRLRHLPAFATGVAAALIGVFVVTGLPLNFGKTAVISSASAAEVLVSASEAVGGAPTVEPGDGKLLVTDTKVDTVERIRDDEGTVTAALRMRYSTTTYAAADLRDGNITSTTGREFSGTYGALSRELLAAYQAEYALPTWRDHNEESQVPDDLPLLDTTGTSEQFAALPEDPQEFLSLLVEGTIPLSVVPDVALTPPSELTEEQRAARAFASFVQFTREPGVPAAVLKTAYQAAALIPGIRVIQDVTTLWGDTGTGLALATEETYGSNPDLSETVESMIVLSKTTGAIIGTKNTLLDGNAVLPSGTVLDETGIRMSITDRVPTRP